jgi:basic membrane protein A
VRKFAPRAQLSTDTDDRGVFYLATLEQVLAGTWKPEVGKRGLKENLVVMAPVNPVVPAAGKKAFEDKKTAIEAGRLVAFQGPIMDQSGAVRIAAGRVMPPAELMAFKGCVEGVEGSVPK